MPLSLRLRLPRRRAFTAAVASCLAANLALAQTIGAQAIHGTAVVTQQGSRTTITTGNGHGISHSALAVVDTAGFTASILGIPQPDALTGRPRFGSTPGATPGPLPVQGRIVARGTDVVLIASQPDTGAPALVDPVGGDTILAAGRKVEITGRGMEGIRMQLQAPGGRATNLGTLEGDPVAIFARQLRHSGLIHAQTATLTGGRVVLTGGESPVVNEHIRAASAQTGGAAPAVARLVLRAAAFIDVSHLHGGTGILPGARWQGHDTRVADAPQVDSDAGVLLRTDATWSGPGGPG